VSRPAFGLDFGTTNSAIARVDGDAQPRLARFPTQGGPLATFRSVLYFDREEDGPTIVRAGPDAIARYLESEEKEGRLIQSLKSFLASRLFSATSVFGSVYRLENLIGLLLGARRSQAERDFGEPVERAVVGRPVHFVGASSPDDETLALTRLEAALHNAGFRDVVFEYEPVGAAYHYERGLESDELILIADFGGGTSDFSLLRVGPSFASTGSRADSILGHDGVGVAGDAFDGKLVRHLVAPHLGRGASFRSQFGRTLPVPGWIYAHLERWHHVSFLKSRKTMQILLDLRREALEPEKLDALIRVVEGDLGYLIYHATEAAKHRLSREDQARFDLVRDGLAIEAPVARESFEAWVAEELTAIGQCVDRLLGGARVEPAEVDRVFLTGGSSFVPAVRRIFDERFGGERIRSGEELTSVASGLALRAAESFERR
jgi:hypothetical chaperone protein